MMDMDLEALGRIPDQLFTLLTDPTSNLTAALLLYGLIGLMLLILLVLGVLLVMSMPEDEDERPVGDSTTPAADADAGPGIGSDGASAPAVASRPRRWGMTLAVAASVIALVWVATGYSTSQSAVCTGCHLEGAHTAIDVDNPHEAVQCVACHEPGGVAMRYAGEVPVRLLHFVDGFMAIEGAQRYGDVTHSACYSCHEDDIADTTLNAERGIKVSHTEPLEAAATCLDCHVPQAGVVGTHNAGMKQCLRCHDSQTASSECATCHDRTAAAAARSRSTEFAAVQVKEVRCGGCHNEKRECDSCHGVRMPHTRQFMMYDHARAGAVDFWFNNGETCGQCHTENRRPCQKCHGGLLGRGHGTGLAQTHQSGTNNGCSGCHQKWAFTRDRDFCTDLCHTESARSHSPR